LKGKVWLIRYARQELLKHKRKETKENMKNKQTIKDAGYKYIRFDSFLGCHILQDVDTGNKEVFFANKNFSGWGLIYKNTHLEFQCSL